MRGVSANTWGVVPATLALGCLGRGDGDAKLVLSTVALSSLQLCLRDDKGIAQIIIEGRQQLVISRPGLEQELGGQRRAHLARAAQLLDLAHNLGSDFSDLRPFVEQRCTVLAKGYLVELLGKDSQRSEE